MRLNQTTVTSFHVDRYFAMRAPVIPTRASIRARIGLEAMGMGRGLGNLRSYSLTGTNLVTRSATNEINLTIPLRKER